MSSKTEKTHTLVKLDDKIVEIVQGPKGLKARFLSDDELFNVNVFDRPIEQLLENDINKITNEAYEELKKSFKTTLKQNVLKVVGFKNRWDENWEVDHCNGRTSIITDYMSESVKQMFREEFQKLNQADIQLLIQPLKKIILKEFKEGFEREVRMRVRDSARTEAETFVKKLTSQQIQKYQKELTKKVETSFLGRLAKPEKEEEDWKSYSEFIIIS